MAYVLNGWFVAMVCPAGVLVNLICRIPANRPVLVQYRPLIRFWAAHLTTLVDVSVYASE